MRPLIRQIFLDWLEAENIKDWEYCVGRLWYRGLHILDIKEDEVVLRDGNKILASDPEFFKKIKDIFIKINEIDELWNLKNN